MMKHKTYFLSLVLGMAGQCAPLLADVPKAQPVTRYKTLWESSRLTSKPPPPEAEEEINKLDDYTLLSVTPLGKEYMISIRHKKDAAEGRIRILPGETNSKGFVVMAVDQSPTDFMATKVKLSYNGKVGVVEYDEKFLAIKKPAVAAQSKGRTAKKPTAKPAATPRGQVPPGLEAAGLTNTVAPNTNKPSGGTPARKPRVRRVPTPPTR